MTRRMFLKGVDKITSKAHQAGYLKGYDAAMTGKGTADCQYKRKAGGWGFRKAWLMGFKDGVEDL